MMDWLLGLISLAISTAFVLAASWALTRRLRTPSPAADLVVFLLLFTCIQSLLILAAGVTGLLSRWPLTLLCAGGLVACRLAGEWPDFRGWKGIGVRTRWEIALAALVVCGGVALVVKSLLFSPYWPDALYYHLSKVAEWMRAGAFVHDFSRDPRVWFTAGFEVVETWWVVFLGRDALIEFGGLQMLALALASVRALAQALGYRSAPAVAIFAFVPVVILHVTACGNDLAVAAVVLAGFALVASRAPLPLQALPLVLGAGIKASVLFAVPSIVFYMFLVNRPARMSRPLAVAVLSLAAVVGGFWYARNLALKGHPLYPVYGETANMKGLRFELSSQLYQLRLTVEDLPERAGDPRQYGAFSKAATGWGWFILPFGLPLMVGALRQDRAFRRLALAFVLGWAATLAFSPFNDFNLRFAIWFPALPAIAAARGDFRAVRIALVATAMLNFVATLAPASLHTYDAVRIPDDAARGRKVAWLMAGQLPTYLGYGKDFSRGVVFPRTLEEFRASGARVIWAVHRAAWMEKVPELRRVSGNLYELPQGR